MELSIIDRLFASFGELESAISKARTTLHRRGTIPENVLERLDSYDAILAKQRSLATVLCTAISQKDWEQVTRNVELINGLSGLIRKDAQAILHAIATNSLGTEDFEGELAC